MAKRRISELEDMSIETEKQVKKDGNKTEYPNTMGAVIKTVYVYRHLKRRRKKMGQKRYLK
jgi:hypothetical protein